MGDRLVLGRPGLRLPRAPLPEQLPAVGVAQQPHDGVGERPRVAVRDEFGGVADEFGGAADPGRDQRHARVEGLLGERGARLPPAGQQREVGGGQQVEDVLAPADEPDRQVLVLDPPLEFTAQRPLPRDDDQRHGVEAAPRVRGVQQGGVTPVPFEGAGGDEQRASDGPEFGPDLGAQPVGVLRPRGRARPGERDRGQPGVPRPRAARPVDEGGGGPEHHGGRLDDPPLQHPEEVGARAVGVRPVVPGHDQRGVPSAEGEHRAEGGVQSVRVHQVGVRAGGPQRGHRPRVAAARHVHVVGAGAREVVGVIRLGGGAHRDPHAPRDEPRGQRAHVGAAGGVAAAQHLHGAQRRPAVR
ncbi:hypothetical protein GCM10019016_110650 [Streptomyces prasinosporus]|uniref:Uncharacterized protein n=1 Tax=Streptomyces prasinosporus TaxID=68256 RepID=A0ABP6UBD5_9ACTN